MGLKHTMRNLIPEGPYLLVCVGDLMKLSSKYFFKFVMVFPEKLVFSAVLWTNELSI